VPRSTSPLAEKAIDWLFADEIGVCNGDLIVAITKVIVGITIPIENHMILSKDLSD
jgi:hypothetical protein